MYCKIYITPIHNAASSSKFLVKSQSNYILYCTNNSQTFIIMLFQMLVIYICTKTPDIQRQYKFFHFGLAQNPYNVIPILPCVIYVWISLTLFALVSTQVYIARIWQARIDQVRRDLHMSGPQYQIKIWVHALQLAIQACTLLHCSCSHKIAFGVSMPPGSILVSIIPSFVKQR